MFPTLKNLNLIYNRTTAGEPAVLLGLGLEEKDVTLSGCNLLDSKKGKDAVAIKVNKPVLDIKKVDSVKIKEDLLKDKIEKAPQKVINSAIKKEETTLSPEKQIAGEKLSNPEELEKAIDLNVKQGEQAE